jgi:MFS superfamily sulfate permease-like transporter
VSPDAFARLALIAGAIVLVAGVAAIGVFVSVTVALAGGIGGIALALAISQQQASDEEPKEEAPDLDGLSRRDIVRRSAGR